MFILPERSEVTPASWFRNLGERNVESFWPWKLIRMSGCWCTPSVWVIENPTFCLLLKRHIKQLHLLFSHLLQQIRVYSMVHYLEKSPFRCCLAYFFTASQSFSFIAAPKTIKVYQWQLTFLYDRMLSMIMRMIMEEAFIVGGFGWSLYKCSIIVLKGWAWFNHFAPYTSFYQQGEGGKPVWDCKLMTVFIRMENKTKLLIGTRKV